MLQSNQRNRSFSGFEQPRRPLIVLASMAPKSKLRWSRIGGGVVLVGALLAWPAPGPGVPDAPAGGRPFVWGRDSLWNALDSGFAAARKMGCTFQDSGIENVAASVRLLQKQRVAATDPALDSLVPRALQVRVRAAADSIAAGTLIAAPRPTSMQASRTGRRWDSPRRHGGHGGRTEESWGEQHTTTASVRPPWPPCLRGEPPRDPCEA